MSKETQQLTHARLMEIVEVAANSAARNIGVPADQVLPHIYLPLKRALLPDELAAEVTSGAGGRSVLKVAEEAIQDAVLVMANELDGLRVIQPKLAKLREALQLVRAELAHG